MKKVGTQVSSELFVMAKEDINIKIPSKPNFGHGPKTIRQCEGRKREVIDDEILAAFAA